MGNTPQVITMTVRQLTKLLVCIILIAVAIGAGAMAAAIHYGKPYCPHEDSCRPSWRDESWHIDEINR